MMMIILLSSNVDRMLKQFWQHLKLNEEFIFTTGNSVPPKTDRDPCFIGGHKNILIILYYTCNGLSFTWDNHLDHQDFGGGNKGSQAKREIFLKIEIDFSCQPGIIHPMGHCFALQPSHYRSRK